MHVVVGAARHLGRVWEVALRQLMQPLAVVAEGLGRRSCTPRLRQPGCWCCRRWPARRQVHACGRVRLACRAPTAKHLTDERASGWRQDGAAARPQQQRPLSAGLAVRSLDRSQARRIGAWNSGGPSLPPLMLSPVHLCQCRPGRGLTPKRQIAHAGKGAPRGAHPPILCPRHLLTGARQHHVPRPMLLFCLQGSQGPPPWLVRGRVF